MHEPGVQGLTPLALIRVRVYRRYAMNPNSHPCRPCLKPVLGAIGASVCISLVSCVVPYDDDHRSVTTVTHYQPGYQVQALPSGYRSETIAGNTYYYHDGYYYQPRSGGYVVVDAPRRSRYYDDYGRRHVVRTDDRSYGRTEVIARLPDGYRVVNHRGSTLYQVGDRYYRRDRGGYVVVGSPY